ncbi:MAG: alpha/beta fold hydrolase [Granulosicoccus sp.]
MKTRIIKIVCAVVGFNLALVLLTLLLSVKAGMDYPMQGTLVQAGVHQLHVIDSGNSANHQDDTTVVLIHGASTSALDFSTYLHPQLARQWRVLSIDRPGHGYSDRGPRHLASDPAHQAQMILDTLNELEISNPVLIGHSWAGSVVMAALMAEHDHIQVKAGVLISGATHPWEGGSAWHVELSARPVLGNLFVWQYIAPLGRLALEGAVASTLAPDPVPENYIENTGLTLSLRPQTYRHNALDRTRLSNYLALQSTRYATINQPLLSIAASEDTVVPPWNHHDRLVDQIEQLQTLIVDGAGHAPHHTHSELVGNTIESFLVSLRP